MNRSFDKNQPTEKLRTNVPRMLIAVAALLVIAYYGTTALSTQDPLWFTAGFSGQPARMIAFHNGQRTEIGASHAAFADLAAAVQSSLAQGVSHASSIGYSQGSLEDAYNEYVTLEVFFEQPVKLHATFNTGKATHMLFPLTGRHSEQPLVLLGYGGQYMANAPVLKTVEPVRMVMRDLGYLP